MTPQHFSTSEEWAGEFRLQDGGVVRFRPVRPEDQELIAEAIRTASKETLLHRFFSPIRGVPGEALRKMLVIDRTRDLCLVGVTEEKGKARIICGARYVRLEQPQTAEIALTVHDDYQRRGIGKFMLKLLIESGLREGIRWFEADVMSSNVGMLKLIERVIPARERWHQSGDVEHIVMRIDGSSK